MSVQIETRRADKRVKRNVEYGWGVGKLFGGPLSADGMGFHEIAISVT